MTDVSCWKISDSVEILWYFYIFSLPHSRTILKVDPNFFLQICSVKIFLKNRREKGGEKSTTRATIPFRTREFMADRMPVLRHGRSWFRWELKLLRDIENFPQFDHLNKIFRRWFDSPINGHDVISNLHKTAQRAKSDQWSFIILNKFWNFKIENPLQIRSYRSQYHVDNFSFMLC